MYQYTHPVVITAGFNVTSLGGLLCYLLGYTHAAFILAGCTLMILGGLLCYRLGRKSGLAAGEAAHAAELASQEERRQSREQLEEARLRATEECLETTRKEGYDLGWAEGYDVGKLKAMANVRTLILAFLKKQLETLESGDTHVCDGGKISQSG
jgi:hypothetical protein